MNMIRASLERRASRVLILFSIVTTLACTALAKPPATAAVSCESLRSLKLPNTTIDSAETIAAGAYSAAPGRAPAAPTNLRAGDAAASAPAAQAPAAVPRGGARGGPSYADLPAFCRVQATIRPVADSEIKIEAWLPTNNWNSKFEAVGSGGYAGAIAPAALAMALRAGYASATTDTGHTGGNADFMQGHPEKKIDFGYRAVHEMTVKGQAIVAAYYGSAAKYSYFNGCSTGGRQALQEAQRFPNDFDGIIAGAPANFTTHMTAQQLWVGLAVHKDEASFIPPEKYKVLHQAVLDACDTLDGVKDGVLENPRACKFDPHVVGCKGADTTNCLTAPQIEAVVKIYNGPNPPYTKQYIFPSMEFGSEAGWPTFLAGPNAFGYALDNWRYVILQNPDWQPTDLNFDADIAKAERLDPDIVTANNPDLRPFFAHGGKLIQYHGWADPGIMPGNSVNYYKSVVAKVGMDQVKDNYRLFMVPGMGHCGGGDGPSTFDMLKAMEHWREDGKAPEQIIASKVSSGGAIERTRPLCPYPQEATYKGTGSTDDAANFVCKAR